MAFKATCGHCQVPKAYSPNPPLGRWVQTQRYAHQRSRLSSKRFQRLDELGFVWQPARPASTFRPERWEQMFRALLEFKNHHGHCLVPARWTETPGLGQWVSNQRITFRHGALIPERHARLASVGFVWRVPEQQWDRLFAQLQESHRIHGHCRVPAKWPENPRLGEWVSRLRHRYKLSPAQRRQLDDIGFIWDTRQAAWERRLAKLVEFKNEHGHCRASRSCPDPSLRCWVIEQRRHKKSGRLNAERLRRLNEIGFIWDARRCQHEDQPSVRSHSPAASDGLPLPSVPSAVGLPLARRTGQASGVRAKEVERTPEAVENNGREVGRGIEDEAKSQSEMALRSESPTLQPPPAASELQP